MARWPETPLTAGCGEGEPDRKADGPERQTCGTCLYWDRPGIGIDPARRGDHLSTWWQKAGWCRRFAPTPGAAIGEYAFWRATHSEDHCYDGRPAD